MYIIPWIEFLFSNFFFLFMNWSQFSVRHIAKCYLNLLLQYCVQQHNNLFFGRIKAVFPFTLFAFHNLKNDRRVDSTQYYGTKWGMHQGCHPSTWKVDMKNENESNTNFFQYQKSQILTIFWFRKYWCFLLSSLFTFLMGVSAVLAIRCFSCFVNRKIGTKFLKQYEKSFQFFHIWIKTMKCFIFLLFVVCWWNLV